MRLVTPQLSEKWKQPVVIENRPGANTNIGTVLVTKADADGHTLLFSSDGTFIFNPLIYSSMPYSVSELTPVSLVGTSSAMLAIATHVPFKGANETVMAMLANQMDAAFSTLSNILPHLPTGRLRALAVTTAERSPQAPDVPTMQEAGVPGYETYSMFGLFAPARPPAETSTCRARLRLNFSGSSIKTPSSGRRSSRPPSSKTRSRKSRASAH